MTGIVKQHRVVELDYQHFDGEDRSQKIVVDSRFDSGNLGTAYFDPHNRDKVTESHQLVIKTEPDSDYKGNSNLCRSWFYFRVTGFHKGTFILLSVGNLNLLSSIVSQIEVSTRNKKWPSDQCSRSESKVSGLK